MAYTKKIWVSNEVITAKGLNNIEQGIEKAHEKINELSSILSSEYVYNVIDNGAIGDGITIENNAIQAILNKALEKNGITIYFPKGKYRIDGPLEVFGNTHLILDDNAIITRKLNKALLINGKNKGTIQYGNIHIEGGVWDADNLTSTFYSSAHFVLGNADNITIENCTFLNNHGGHVLDISGCENMIIRNCKFLGQMQNPDESLFFREAIQIAEFTEAGQPSWGGGWNNRPSKNILIDSCLFDENPSNSLFKGFGCAVGNHAGYNMTEQGCKDIRIENCEINNGYYGLRPCCWTNTIISNCIINNCVEGIHLTSGGKSEVQPGQHSPLVNTKIHNCIISNSENYGIWARGKTAYNDVSDISYIDGIVIDSCTLIDNAIDGSSSIYLDLCKNAIVINNTITNSSRSIWIQSCNNSIVGNNICSDMNKEAIWLDLSNSIEDEDNKPNNNGIKIINNIVSNCGRIGIYVSNTEFFNANENTCMNCSLEEPNARYGLYLVKSNNGILANNIVKGDSHFLDIGINTNCSDLIKHDNLYNTTNDTYPIDDM
jgi:parallel beta-helix repeat protein